MSQSSLTRAEGFTATEIVVSVAVLAAIAYLVLPLAFPGDTLSTEEKLEQDLQQISSILDERERISSLNGTIDSVPIGNLGVFAAHSQIRFTVDVNTDAEQINYCLVASIEDTTYFTDSITKSIGDTPQGFCAPESEQTSDEATSENGDASESSTAETQPSDEVNATTEQNE